MTAQIIPLWWPPDQDQDPAVRRAIEALRAIGRAKEAAYQRDHLKPRQPARLTAEQLAEAYRRSGLRDPRQRVRPRMEAAE